MVSLLFVELQPYRPCRESSVAYIGRIEATACEKVPVTWNGAMVFAVVNHDLAYTYGNKRDYNLNANMHLDPRRHRTCNRVASRP